MLAPRRGAPSSRPRTRSRARALARPGTRTPPGHPRARGDRSPRRPGSQGRAAARPCRRLRRPRRRASSRERRTVRARGRRGAWCVHRSRAGRGTAARADRRRGRARPRAPEGGRPARAGSRAHASAFAADRPTSSAPISPGPWVTATVSTSSRLAPASARASSTTGITSSRWWRDAISGTTPPKRACRCACDETTFERISPAPVTSAAAVSSQLVSTPRIRAARPAPAPGPST